MPCNQEYDPRDYEAEHDARFELRIQDLQDQLNATSIFRQDLIDALDIPREYHSDDAFILRTAKALFKQWSAFAA